MKLPYAIRGMVLSLALAALIVAIDHGPDCAEVGGPRSWSTKLAQAAFDNLRPQNQTSTQANLSFCYPNSDVNTYRMFIRLARRHINRSGGSSHKATKVQECRWCLKALHDWDDYRSWELSPSDIIFFHVQCFRVWFKQQEIAFRTLNRSG